MSLFHSILNSISQKIKEKSSFKESVAEVIEFTIKTKIKPREIKIKEGVLTISTHPTVKSIIFFKKEEIKSRLKEIGVNINTIN